MLAIKLFRDDLRVVVSSLGKTLGLISFYMGHQLRPMVVMLVPIVFLFAQMQMRLAYEPLPVGKKVYVDVELTNAAPGVDAVEVDLPAGLEMAGALVRVPGRDGEPDREWLTSAGLVRRESDQRPTTLLTPQQMTLQQPLGKAFPQNMQLVDIVLRTNTRLAEESGMDRVWDGEIVIESVPIEHIDPPARGGNRSRGGPV